MKKVLALSIAIAFAAAPGFALAADPPARSGTAAPATPAQGAAAKPSADSRSAVRDWAQVDTNKDHSISPEEMEAYLLSNPGPLKKK